MISFAVVVAYSRVQVARHMEGLHTASVQSPVEVVVPIVVDKEAAEVVHMVAVHMVVGAAGPIVVHIEMEVARMVVEVAHKEAAALDLAVGLDHMTWMNPSC